MALRRVLPSRLTGAPAPEDKAAPATQKPAPIAASTTSETPVETPAPAVPASRESLAAAASSAFSTLPTAGSVAQVGETPPEQPAQPQTPARVLEESFTIPAAAQEEQAPAPAQPAEPAAPVEMPAPQPAAEQQAEALQPEEQPAPIALQGEETPTPAEEKPVAVESVAPQPQPEPAPQAVTEQPQPRQSVAPSFPPRGKPSRQIKPRSHATAAAPQTAPKAEESSIPVAPRVEEKEQSHRRVRDKKPRDFSAPAAEAAARASAEQPAKQAGEPSSKVPQDTRPLEKVDEELIASGIIAAPPPDSLTSAVPTGLAEAESAAPAPELPPEHTPEQSPEQPPELSEAPQSRQAGAETTQQAWQPKPVPDAPVQEDSPLQPQQTEEDERVTPLKLSTQEGKEEPLPPVGSDLPWAAPQAAAGDWDISVPEAPSWEHEASRDDGATAPSDLPPPSDLYKPMDNGTFGGAPVPPWQQPNGKHGAASLPPPELPGNVTRKAGGMPWGLVVVALVAAGLVAVYVMHSGGGQGTIAQLTGTLQEQTEALPAGSGTLKPDQTFSMADMKDNNIVLPPPAQTTAASPSALAALGLGSPTVVVSSALSMDFANTAAQPSATAEAGQTEQDHSVFARFQQAVNDVRAREQEKAENQTSSTEQVAAADKADTSPLTPEKLQEELASYRRALTASPNPSALKPAAFHRSPDAYMDGQAMQQSADVSGTQGTLLPPPQGAAAQATAQQQAALLPPPELYANNPKNLPIVAEPSAKAPAHIRTLADFNVDPNASQLDEIEKVEIPKGLRPRLASTDFPSLQVLSFVPNRGIVAYANGREGVLLIGESLNGWQLVGVAPDRAEFRLDGRNHEVTAND